MRIILNKKQWEEIGIFAGWNQEIDKSLTAGLDDDYSEPTEGEKVYDAEVTIFKENADQGTKFKIGYTTYYYPQKIEEFSAKERRSSPSYEEIMDIYYAEDVVIGDKTFRKDQKFSIDELTALGYDVSISFNREKEDWIETDALLRNVLETRLNPDI